MLSLFLNPRLLPLLEAHAFDFFADDLVLNAPKQQFELPKELVIKLNIIPQETQKKLLSLLTTGKINVEQYSSKDMVFYDFALLQQYEQFTEQKTFSERRIIQEFYTSVLRSLKEYGCDEKQAEFLSLFQNIPCACLESLRRNHIQNGDFVELYHLFEEELLETPAILQAYFSDKENTTEQRF